MSCAWDAHCCATGWTRGAARTKGEISLEKCLAMHADAVKPLLFNMASEGFSRHLLVVAGSSLFDFWR